jgi:hypothetical protein
MMATVLEMGYSVMEHLLYMPLIALVSLVLDTVNEARETKTGGWVDIPLTGVPGGAGESTG